MTPGELIEAAIAAADEILWPQEGYASGDGPGYLLINEAIEAAVRTVLAALGEPETEYGTEVERGYIAPEPRNRSCLTRCGDQWRTNRDRSA